jgi:hypothetical protein
MVLSTTRSRHTVNTDGPPTLDWDLTPLFTLFFSNWGLHDHCYWTFKLYLRASPKIVAFTSLLPWRFPIIESHPSSSLLPPLMHQFQSPSWRCRVRVYLRDRCYKLALAPSLNWYISSSELPRPLRRTILIAILQSISSHIGTRELHRPRHRST